MLRIHDSEVLYVQPFDFIDVLGSEGSNGPAGRIGFYHRNQIQESHFTGSHRVAYYCDGDFENLSSMGGENCSVARGRVQGSKGLPPAPFLLYYDYRDLTFSQRFFGPCHPRPCPSSPELPRLRKIPNAGTPKTLPTSVMYRKYYAVPGPSTRTSGICGRFGTARIPFGP